MSLESTHASLHGVSDDKPYRCEMCGNHFLTGECAPAQQVIGSVARVRQSGHACILILNCPPPYTHTVAKLQKHFDQLHTRELKKRTKGRGVKGKKGVDARLRRYGGEEKLARYFDAKRAAGIAGQGPGICHALSAAGVKVMGPSLGGSWGHPLGDHGAPVEYLPSLSHN